MIWGWGRLLIMLGQGSVMVGTGGIYAVPFSIIKTIVKGFMGLQLHFSARQYIGEEYNPTGLGWN